VTTPTQTLTTAASFVGQMPRSRPTGTQTRALPVTPRVVRVAGFFAINACSNQHKLEGRLSLIHLSRLFLVKLASTAFFPNCSG
jgi:hypothetical protein